MEAVFLGRVRKDFVTELWGIQVEGKREREIRSLNTYSLDSEGRKKALR